LNERRNENMSESNLSTVDPTAEPQGNRKTRVGVVVSDKMEKTIVVNVERRVPHPHFGKIVRKSKKFYVHDEDGAAKEGDKGPD